jgi:hypothetical protein|nr:MAG TPA: hypothetical protein [Caudoviricetes sp.]
MNAIEYTDRKRKVIQLMQKEFAAIPFQILDEKDWKKNAELILPNNEDLFKKLEIQPTNEVWQNVIYMCDDFYIDSEYCNVDKLYELGFVPIYYREYYFLIIQGIGYDVIDEHFTPLFEYLNWLR